MTTHTRLMILLLAIALLAFTLCACDEVDGTGDARREWQREVLGRQRGLERPTPTVEVTQ